MSQPAKPGFGVLRMWPQRTDAGSMSAGPKVAMPIAASVPRASNHGDTSDSDVS